MEKYCPGCETTKSTSEFNKNRSRHDGLQNYCKGCKKGIEADFYKKNTKKIRTRNVTYRQKLQQWIDEEKKSGCIVCFEDDVCCLDFHHVDGDDKVANVSALKVDKGMTAVREEIAKCVILCSNCHRKLHAGRFCLLAERERYTGVV